MLQHKQIAIIGGGPGGLTLAKLLQCKGANVKVFERDVDRNVRLQGGALDLHTESGLAALEKAGLMDEFKKLYRPGAELIRVVDSQGRIHFDDHIKARESDFGDKGHRPEIDRGPLRDILLDSLAPGTVMWNSHILSVEKVGDAWKLNFQDGNVFIADLVIGADGANSKIRPFVTDAKPLWTGITMIEGSIKDAAKTAPTIRALLQGGKIFAYGDDKTLIVSSKGDGSLGFTTGVKTGEHWVTNSGIDFKDNKQVLAWFKKEYAGWSDIWDELFASEDTLFIPRPQYCMPLDQQWEAKSNITLIGDAAHWMPPFAGEGVNMAMLDALELSEALTDPSMKSLAQAIGKYQSSMLKRFEKVGQATLFNTNWMHSPKALDEMLSMFSENKFKQGLFVVRYFCDVFVVPFFRKLSGMGVRQKALIPVR